MFLSEGINVLSLFDGMSCGRIALSRSGVGVKNYYASEIDKYAIQVSDSHWSNIKLGDVTNWREWDIDWSTIDLVLAGSPCQGFSFAGKQLAFDDPRSALFFEFVNILNHIRRVNPSVKFLLENVKMKKEFLNAITSHVGVPPVFINSALVSAQNRQRYYWCNWQVTQPPDRGIRLIDIIDEDGHGVIKSHGKWHSRPLKSMCIDANYHKGADNHGQRTMIAGGTLVGRRINPETGMRDDNNLDLPAVQRVEMRAGGKSGCLTSVQKDNILIMQRPRGNNPGGTRAHTGKSPVTTSCSWEQNNKIYVRDKSKTIRTSGRQSVNRHEWDSIDDAHTRKLTPVECERLQTVPDNYTASVSNTQRYRMLGNGWTAEVVKHLLDSSGLHRD